MPHKCCVRMRRAKSDYLAAMGAHGRREGPGVDHVDFSRSHRNLFGLTSKAAKLGIEAEFPEKVVARYIQENGIQVRKDSATAMHLIIIVSPSFFEKRDSNGSLCRMHEVAQVKKVLELLIDWSEADSFPGDLLCWRVDMDETTPHIDLFIVPTYIKKTKRWVSVNKCLGGRGGKAALSKLQTDLATALVPLGIVRGTPKSITGSVHVPPQVYRKQNLAQNLEAITVAPTFEKNEKRQSIETEAQAAALLQGLITRDELKESSGEATISSAGRHEHSSTPIKPDEVEVATGTSPHNDDIDESVEDELVQEYASFKP